MKQKFETPKFYYGFTIYILGYKCQQFSYNITTSSSSYSMAEKIDAPLLDDCPFSLECIVEGVQEFDNYVNFTARIVNHWVDDGLLDEKGHFKSEAFHPLEYMGDGKGRIDRYLDEEKTEKLGQFSKKGKKLKFVEDEFR